MLDEGKRPVEPQYTADEYIDDLPLRDTSPPASFGGGRANGTTRPIKRAGIRPGTVVGLLGAVALFACGWTIAALQYVTGDRLEAVPGEPLPAVTVTVTETEVSLPPACQKALRDFDKYLDAAASISKANTPQLDLMAEANQAIMLKDWKKLGELTDRQRELERSLGPSSSKLIPVLLQVKKGMETCRSQLN